MKPVPILLYGLVFVISSLYFAPRSHNKTELSYSVEKTAPLIQPDARLLLIAEVIESYPQAKVSATQLAREVLSISKAHKVDPLLVTSIIAAESGFRPRAVSKVGARGLMQLLPSTARYVAKRINYQNKSLQLYETNLNITLGIEYLKYLETKFNGNRVLALAAYNWGPSNVNQRLRKNQRLPRSVRNYANTILKRQLSWEKRLDTIAGQSVVEAL